MFLPNLKRIAHFVQKLLGSQISPRRRPLPGGTGPPKFNQLETVTSDILISKTKTKTRMIDFSNTETKTNTKMITKTETI